MRTPLSATAQDAAIAGNFGTVSNDKTVTMATLTNQSMKYTSFYKRVQTWIHRPQKVQGLLLQWELRGKHQIRNVISRQSNVVECWNFVWLCVTIDPLKDTLVVQTQTMKYIYIHCITRRYNYVHFSIGFTFKIVFYGESDVIHFINFDSGYCGDPAPTV